MSTYNTKVYTEQGGDKLVVESGGELEVQSGATVDIQAALLLDDHVELKLGDSNDVTLDWDTAGTDSLRLKALANNTPIEVGSSTLSFDVTVDGSTGYVLYDASADTLHLVSTILSVNGQDVVIQDDDELRFGDSYDVTIDWDTSGTATLKVLAVADNTPIAVGASGSGKQFDVTLHGSASTLAWDASADLQTLNGADLNLQDDDLLKFGDSSDVTIDWDTSGTDMLKVLAAANNTNIDIGSTTLSFDIVLDSSAGNLTFDASANSLTSNNVDLVLDAANLDLKDDDLLRFGDSADVTVDWDTAGTDMLKIIAAANNTNIDVGAAGKQFDVILYGTSGNVTWDASANLLDINAAKLDLNNATSSIQFYLAAAANTARIGPGGMRMYTNTTGAILAINTTGTTWKTAQFS